MVPGRGSLGEVLPDSLKALFPRAASAFPEIATIAWTGRSGRVFEFRVCRPPSPEEPGVHLEAQNAAVTPRDLLGSVGGASSLLLTTVTEWLGREDSASSATAAAPRDIVVGRLVHRLFQFHRRPGANDDTPDSAHALLDAEDRLTLENPDDAVREAWRLWRSMCETPAVAELMEQGRSLHEVPFSMVLGEGARRAVVRGTIDSLVQRRDGSVVVVEFKTGAKREIHDRQLDLYVAAARTMFPGVVVSGQLVYP